MKPGNDQAHALFDPDADDAQHAGDVEPFQAAADRQHQQDHGDQVERDGGPDPRHQRVMAVQADETGTWRRRRAGCRNRIP